MSAFSGKRILIVDDEPDISELLANEFLERGADVRCAANAAEALASLDGFAPDLLISDVSMPGMDGFALAREVRARAGDAVRVMLVSGNHDSKPPSEGYYLISKPFQLSNILDLASRALGIVPP